MDEPITPGFNKNREDARKASFLSGLEKEITETDALVQREAVQQAQQKATPQQPPSQDSFLYREFGPEGLKETGRVLGGAVRNVGQSAVDLVYDVTDAVSSLVFDTKLYTDEEGNKKNRLSLPEVSAPQGQFGDFQRSTTQFLLPFAVALRALQGVQAANTAQKAVAAGAVTDIAAFDPNETRIAHLVASWSAENSLQKEVFDYFSGKDDKGSRLTNRLKAGVEGAYLGHALEAIVSPIIKGLGRLRDFWRGQGKDPAQAFQEAATKQVEDIVAGKAEPTIAEIKATVEDAAATRQAKKEAQHPVEEWFQRVAKEDAAVEKAVAEKVRLKLLPQEQADAAIAKLQERAPRAYVKEDGSILLSRADEAAGEIPLSQKVEAALSKEGFERSADDLVALKAYRQLQESLFKDIIVPPPSAGTGRAAFSDAERRAATSKLELPQSAGSGQAIDQSLREEVQGLSEAIAANNKKILEEIKRSGQAASRGSNPALSEGKVLDLPKADPQNPYGSDIVLFGSSGFVTPEQLLKVASLTGRFAKHLVSDSKDLAGGAAGGVAGYNSADENATTGDKLKLGALGFLAGAQTAKFIKNPEGSSVRNSRELQTQQGAADSLNLQDVQSQLARDEGMKIVNDPRYAGISPLDVTQKPARLVQIKQAKVDQLVQAVKGGKLSSVIRDIDTADFNFEHIDSAEELEEVFNAVSSVFEKEISHAKGGVQSFGDISKLAEELGSGVGTLKGLYGDTQNLAARVTSHRILLTASAKKVSELAHAAAGGDEAAMLAFRKHVTLHASIQARMKGVQTEIARALSAYRIKATHADLVTNEVNELVSALGGTSVNRDMAKKMAVLTDVKKINKFARGSYLARTNNAIFEYWVNSILSGPITHAANITGNTLVAIGGVAERYTMASLGRVVKSSDPTTFAEANAYAFGLMSGLRDAISISNQGFKALGESFSALGSSGVKGAQDVLRANASEFGTAYRAFATDAPVLDSALLGTREAPLAAHAISAENLNLTGTLGAAADWLGALTRTPGRFLVTADEIFKTMNYRAELKAQAYRKAREEGLAGTDLAKRIEELVEGTGDITLQQKALTTARENTFTKPLEGNLAEWQKALSHSPVMRYVVPFFRTPVNIISYTFDHTPVLNLLRKENVAKLEAGGAARDEVIAKMATGSVLYTTAVMLADSDMIVGSLGNRPESERLAGEIPYSFKVNGEYYAFNRTDPIGMFFGLAADFSKLYKSIPNTEADKLTAMMMTAISNNLVSKSYLSGVVDIISAFTDSERSGRAWDKVIQKYASSFVPASSLVRTARRETDPVVREVWSAMEAIKNTIPGLSDELYPLLNVFGEEVKSSGSLGPDALSPIYSSKLRDDDPAVMEIYKNNVDLQRPERTINISGAPPIHLSHEQHHKYSKRAGELFKERLDKLVASAAYKRLSDNQGDFPGSKATEIRQLWSKVKDQALKELERDDEDYRIKVRGFRKAKADVLSGKPIFPFAE